MALEAAHTPHPTNTPSTDGASPALERDAAPRAPEVSLSAEPAISRTPTEFFAEKFLTSLTQQDFDAISKILDADPYMNGGRPQKGSSPVVATTMEYASLVQQYKDGGVAGQRDTQPPLSPDSAKAFDMLASWYQVYRAAFPDATETESLQNIFEYLKDTKNGDMKWGICLKADHYGNVQAAFSGQVLEASVPSSAGQETTIPFAWGEHVFVDRNNRGQGLGREMVAGFEEQFSKNFGKVPVVVIEVDNAFGILDRNDPANVGFFNHEDLGSQRALWTDPEGQNMAMNPFERLRAWSKLGFKLITVERADLNPGEDRVAMPYTQVPLNKGGEPCETLVLAVRITDPSIIDKIETGEWTVKEFNAMYSAMQQTIDEEYQQNPAFNAAQAEMKMLKDGDTSRVRLVDFLSEDGRTLNPEALAIMARTADEKLTQERYAPAEQPSSSPGVTRESFNAEMTFERRGYRPVAFYGTVEQALASKVDPSKMEVFVDVKKGGFTAEEVAAIPDNAKRNNYHLGFARQLFDANEGIFTKGFWTSSEGIKKVLAAGFIKAETEEIHLEAAQWLLSKREGGGPVSPVAKPEPKADPVPTKAKESAAVDAVRLESSSGPEVKSSPEPTPTPVAAEVPAPLESSSGPEVKSSPEPTPTPVAAEVLLPGAVSMPRATTRRAEPSMVVDVPAHEPAEDTKRESGSSVSPDAPPTPTSASSAREEAVALLSSLDTKPQTTPTTPPLRNEPKVFEMADLQPIETRLQEKFAALKASITPKTLTVVVEDSASIEAVIEKLHFCKDFNNAFAEEISKTQAVLKQVGKLGLDEPSQAIVFKRKQDEALRLIDTLSFSKSDLASMADKIEGANGRYLPGAMREAVNNAAFLLDAIKADLEEARNIIRNARRINPSPKVNQPNPEETSQVVTGSVAKMPRLGKEFTVDPKKLESMGHAMVDANVPDQQVNEKYKAIMSEFVKSYARTFSKIRKEIYEARMDGSNLNSMQKEKFTYLAEELGQLVQVSDLMEIGLNTSADTTKVGAHFGRIVDGSSFQKKLNEMKEEFSKALMKEIEKTPGTTDTDTTYVAYKRLRYEKSGITEFLKS